jgi:hypothetical protein
MRTKIKVLALATTASAAFVFALPNSPNTPASLRQKVGNYLKDKGKDKLRDLEKGFAKDKAADKVMEVGEKYVGGPFKKSGGDYPALNAGVHLLFNWGTWVDSPLDAVETAGNVLKIVMSDSATPEQDTPDYHPNIVESHLDPPPPTLQTLNRSLRRPQTVRQRMTLPKRHKQLHPLVRHHHSLALPQHQRPPLRPICQVIPKMLAKATARK